MNRQRGDEYGITSDANPEKLITRNLTDKMMDDSDATHSKPIENFFGNFDRDLEKTGAQGFDKVSNDLLIKYSKDLIDKGHKWRSKENRKKAKELKLLQNDFDKKQKDLISLGIDEEDSVKLTHENKILKCISKCKEHHNGPLTTSAELEEIIES